MASRTLSVAVRTPLNKGVLAVCATGLVTTATVGTGAVAFASGHWHLGSSSGDTVHHHHYWASSPSGQDSDGSAPALQGSATTLQGSASTLPGSATTLPGSATTLAGPATTLPGPATTLPSPDTTLPSPDTTLPSTAAATGTSSEPPASLMPDSMFTQDVQSWGVDPDSPAYVANLVAQYESAYGAVGVNFNRPVYDVPASQAMVPISVTSGCNDFTGGQATANGSGATGTEVPIPSYAQPGDSSDNILTVYQPSTNKAWEFWEAVNNGNGTWSACWGGELNMATSDGVFPDPYGETAAGISNLATEITESDIASGSINHAIAFELLGDDCDWSSTEADGGLFPADRTDCGYDIAGAPAEGQWFRFPANLAMPSGLTPFAQMVFKAVQTYGMVAVDQGGAVMLEADDPSVWSQEGNSGTDPITASQDGLPEYQVVASLPWQELETVVPPKA